MLIVHVERFVDASPDAFVFLNTDGGRINLSNRTASTSPSGPLRTRRAATPAADPRTHDIPVVIASADALPGRVRQLREEGAFAYLTKPLDLTQSSASRRDSTTRIVVDVTVARRRTAARTFGEARITPPCSAQVSWSSCVTTVSCADKITSAPEGLRRIGSAFACSGHVFG
jgi:hypothetical protein